MLRFMLGRRGLEQPMIEVACPLGSCFMLFESIVRAVQFSFLHLLTHLGSSRYKAFYKNHNLAELWLPDVMLSLQACLGMCPRLQ